MSYTLQESLESLASLNTIISLQAVASSDNPNVSFLSRTISHLSQRFGEFAGLFGSSKDAAIQLTKEEKTLIKQLEKFRYADILHWVVYVPAGLNVNYIDYVNTLEEAMLYCNGVTDRLNQLDTYVGLVTGSKSFRNSSHVDPRAYVAMAAARSDINKQLGLCFERDLHSTEREYGTTIARQGDWEPLFHTLTKLVKTANTVNRVELDKKTNEVAARFEQLNEYISKGMIEDAAPEVVQTLSEAAYQVASELEFFAATYYRVSALAEQVNKTVLKLIDLTK